MRKLANVIQIAGDQPNFYFDTESKMITLEYRQSNIPLQIKGEYALNNEFGFIFHKLEVMSLAGRLDHVCTFAQLAEIEI